MINLLSPQHKTEIYYAKLNRVALRYLRLLVLIVVVLGLIFGFTIFYLSSQTTKVSRDVATTQQQIAALAPFQKQAQDVSTRLAAIKYIQGTQTRFSLLLDDIAKVLPTNVSLNGITLTGDDTKPVAVAVTGTTYDSILAFRNAMATSSRISGVDLNDISQGNGGYTANVVIGFKPGEAK